MTRKHYCLSLYYSSVVYLGYLLFYVTLLVVATNTRMFITIMLHYQITFGSKPAKTQYFSATRSELEIELRSM